MNRNIDTLIIAPISTTTVTHYKFRIPVKVANRRGFIAVDQIRAVSKSRIIKEDVMLSTREIEELKSAISELLLK